MDGIVVFLVAAVLCFIVYSPKDDEVLIDEGGIPFEQIEINPRLNPEMIHDEQAFMKIANELGFR